MIVPQKARVVDPHSYGQVLKSSAVIGLSTVVGLALRVIRTKAMALLIGPGGVGLLGLCDSLVGVTGNLAGLGINSSGVRQIAEAVGSGDGQRIARTIRTLRRVALCTGALGAALMLIFCHPLSRLTFGDERHAGAIALLSLAVLFVDISAAQVALVQGLRRIADLARINVLGALYGTLLSIPIVYFLRERGIVPALVCVAAMSILTSWWYARKVKVERVRISIQQTLAETSALIKLGIALMSGGIFALGAAYLIRIFLLHRIGVEAAGYYQAAWALGGLYIGIILQAMGADYYPRLTAAASDHAKCNRLANEQAEIGVLLAGPGVLATLAFAPLVIRIFYSAKFEPAVDVLRWFCLGMMLRVIIWPMSYMLVAKGRAKLFFWSELVTYAWQLGLVYVCVLAFGLRGAGMAFFGMYIFYWILIYVVVRRLSGFQWSATNRRLMWLFTPLVAAVFVARYVLSPGYVMALGGTLTVGTGIYSLRTITQLVPPEKLPAFVQRLIRRSRATEEIRETDVQE